MKIFIVFLLLCFPIFADENDYNEEYWTLTGLEKRWYLENYDYKKPERTLFRAAVLNLSGRTPEFKEALAAVTDPTNRMLNHTFWQAGTPEEVRKLFQTEKVNLEKSVYTRLFNPDTSSNDLSVLDFALESCRPEMVHAVLDNNINVVYSNEIGITPLMRAARCHPLDVVQRIMDMGGVKTVNWIDEDSLTALNYAEFHHYSYDLVTLGREEVRQYLLDYMAPSDKLLSVTFWKTATVEDFKNELKAGADVNYRRIRLEVLNSLLFAMQYGSEGLIEALLDEKPSYRCSERGIFTHPAEAVKYRDTNDQKALMSLLARKGLDKVDYSICKNEDDIWHVIP